jgi:predicted ATP-grasp superfamily ATP-dependent carboligase
MNAKPDVVVLGSQLTAYGVIRQLVRAKAGLKIAGLYSGPGEVWHSTRYLSERHRSPDPAKDPQGFVQFLLDKVEAWRGALLLPISDVGAQALAGGLSELSRHYAVLAEEQSKIDVIVDKSKLYPLAESLGIGTPLGAKLSGPDDLERFRDRMTFPALVKPSESHRFYYFFGIKLFIVRSFEELAEKCRAAHREGFEMIYQEIIPGPDANLFSHITYRSDDGEYLFEGTKQKLRQSPPRYGVTRVGRTHCMPELSKLSRKLFEALDYRGLCGFEYKKNETTGEWKLLDGNPRFILPNHIFGAAGANLPYLIYLDRVKKARPAKLVCRDGVYWIDLQQDVRYTLFPRNGEKIGFQDFIRPYLKEHVLADLDPTDPVPALWELSNRLKGALKGLVRKSS